MKRSGILYIISAPSGAGKTTLCRELLDIFPELRHSISFTTRKARPGEAEGKDYFFIDQEEFQQMADNGEFAEWAEVHGNLYGTSLRTLEESRVDGVDLILDIDCQGAAKLKEADVQGVTIFILPPSFSELKRRLEGRNSDSKETIEKRVSNAATEINEAKQYDYILVNDVFSKAVEELKSIIIAERLRTCFVIDSLSGEFNIN